MLSGGAAAYIELSTIHIQSALASML